MIECKKVFIDTAPVIYYLENSALYKRTIGNFFAYCIENNVQLITSAITVEEYMVFPYRNNKQVYIDAFKSLVSSLDIQIGIIDSVIAEKAAKIRAEYVSLKKWMHYSLPVHVCRDVICF